MILGIDAHHRAQTAKNETLSRTEEDHSSTLESTPPAAATKTMNSPSPHRASAPSLPAWLLEKADTLGSESSMEYLARHSHSFRYAARFLPAPYDQLVADVYAFCRFTDDLVDDDHGTPATELRARLNDWKRLAERAHAGTPCGFALLDLPLLEMGQRGIPFDYAAELIEGVAMDLSFESSDRSARAHGLERARGTAGAQSETSSPTPASPRYATLSELDRYSYRVASVVGLWLTRLVGVHDAQVLERAADLGHAMQLTNILRDVGEDWRNGRLYLPQDVLARHGITEGDIDRAARNDRGAGLPPGWSAAMEDLMAAADVRYERSFEAVRALPSFFRVPVAVSGLVYRDIHTVIRRNGHDNLTRRAHTSKLRKLWLGVKARLWLARGASDPAMVAPALDAAKGTRRPILSLVTSFLAGAALAATPQATSPSAHGVHGNSRAHLESSATPQASEPARVEDRTQARLRADLARLDAALRSAPANFDLHIARLRILHVLSVHDEKLLGTARAALTRVSELESTGDGAHAGQTAGERAALVSAYRGAFDVVEARHAFWPKARLEPLRRGLPQLDSAVKRAPAQAEIRYLRLTSAYYLPFFLGRSWSVREDFKALASLLPSVRSAYPAEWYVAIADFVLENGDLGERERRQLKRTRTQAFEAASSGGSGSPGSAAASHPDYSRIP
jgi:phytoene synthase